MFNKLKQVRNLRSQAKSLQNTLSQETIAVEHKDCRLKMDGNQKILDLHIDPKHLNPESQKRLEEIIKELYEQALKKVQRVMMSKMKERGDLNIPGLS